jgi:uncharacterized caspase-like protein
MRASVHFKAFSVERLAAMLMAAALLCATTVASAYEDRIALVIGNDKYANEPLKNAANDARAVQKALLDLGFKVVFRSDAGYASMSGAAVEFSKLLNEANGATAAIFYYAGHAIQYRDKNYLLPVDAALTSEAEIAFNSLQVSQILELMEESKVRHKFIILDACRNNPFRNVFGTAGLAKVTRVPPGTTIAFAAAAGAVAADGTEDNGLYTKHLLKEIRNPALQARLMFDNVATAVAQESQGKQLPELQSTALPTGRPFFFAEAAVVAAAAPTPSPTGSTGLSAETSALIERDYWNDIKNSERVELFQEFMRRFPNGFYASLARDRIDNLKREGSQRQVAAAPLVKPAAITPPVLVAEKPAEVPVRPAQAAATSPFNQPASTQAAAPATGQKQATPAPAPIQIAAAPVAATSEGRGIEAPRPTASTPVPATAPASAPPPILVASVAPEQKSALPPAPALPKILNGLIEFRDGSRYVGDYKEDKDKLQVMHGKGEFIDKNFKYTGEFKDNVKHGRGIYVWSDGSRFDGDFRDDKPSGKGKWEFANGDRYEGEVTNGQIVGKGVYFSKDGDRITGSFVDAKANGKVVYEFASGDRFEGFMKDGVMSGEGVYVSKNGERRVGTWVNGVPRGKGSYQFANGDLYEGEFTDGALTGKGKYFFANGLRTEGNFHDGALKGEGKFIFNDGSWFEGIFEEGGLKAKGMHISKDGSKRPAVIIDGRVEGLPSDKQ